MCPGRVREVREGQVLHGGLPARAAAAATAAAEEWCVIARGCSGFLVSQPGSRTVSNPTNVFTSRCR